MNELLVDDRDGVRILTMNRPDKHNALDTALTRSLLDALAAASADKNVRAIVLTGAGKSFCAGADTTEFSALSGDDGTAAADRAALTTALHAAFHQTVKPIVCAVRGNALGGGAGLALAGDLLVVADDMRFGYPELKHGIVAAIVMANLVRQLGRKTAFALVATGRVVGGPEAVRLGLAYESVDASEVVTRAVLLASTLAAWSPQAMAATKQLFYRACELPFDEALEAGRQTNQAMRRFDKPALVPRAPTTSPTSSTPPSETRS